MSRTTIDWAPNFEKDDLLINFGLFSTPWRWFGEKQVKNLEAVFEDKFGIKVANFDSGRSALFGILQVLGIGEGDEVALQAYTCVALPNPILWSGATPIYVDLNKADLNISLEDLKQKVTDKTKALIIQYTFGIVPKNIQEIVDFCKEKGILVIEDCCHNLGQQIDIDGDTKMAGSFGDAAIFSFGNEKIVSGVRGGFGTIKNPEKFAQLKKYSNSLSEPRFLDKLRWLLNSPIYKIRELFGKFGDVIFKLFKVLRLQELGLTSYELFGLQPPWLPTKMSNISAIFVLNQLQKFEKLKQQRLKIAEKYKKALKADKNSINQEIKEGEYYSLNWDELDSCFLRFPIFARNAESIREALKTKGFFVGNWYTEVIHSKGVSLKDLKYTPGSCPNAEELTKISVNLPTHIGINSKKALRLLELLGV